jgi:small subunit ribosomal protein S21
MTLQENMKNDNKSRGLTVVAKENENINQTLRRFKKKVDDAKLLETLKSKEFYEKPTTVRKRKKSAAKARWRKQLKDQVLPPKLY